MGSMNDDPQTQGRRLFQALRRSSRLSLEEARARLPELVMAETAGEDVDTSFADVLAAIDYYPALAEEYASLADELYAELADAEETELAPSLRESSNPYDIPREPPQGADAMTPVTIDSHSWSGGGIVLRRWGDRSQNLLLQLAPQPAPEALPSYMSGDVILYISQWLTDLPNPVQISATLQRTGVGDWELLVELIPGSATTWRVSAMLGQVALPVLERTALHTRFGPVADVPVEPLTLACIAEHA